MRSETEIGMAHDRIVGIILHEVPCPFAPDDKSSTEKLIAAADVLCWVLEHPHNPTFQNQLAEITKYHEEMGFTLHDGRN